MRRLLLTTSALALSSLTMAQLWDNGPFITHPGAGFGGAHVSMASAVPNSAGNNTNGTIVNSFAIADDFTVGGLGWDVTTVEMFAYDSLAPAGVPRFTSTLMEIRDGSPTGTLIATGTTSWAYSGINRVFNGAANLLNTDRQVQRVTGVFNVTLNPGTYWLVHSIQTTGSAWTPYVMDPNVQNPNDPITRVGNAMIRNTGVWAPGTVTTGAWNQAPEHPFIVNGQPVPEPGSMIALGLGAAALLARRRRNKK